MNSFLAHVGAGNSINLGYTLGQRRKFTDVAGKLPHGAERDYFENDAELHRAFPDGTFNVWGVPTGAKEPFERTTHGDTVFFAPSVGNDGCVQFFGIVKVIPHLTFPKASRVLWMDSGDQVFPHLFFFDAERGMVPWFDFMCAIGYSPDWNPKGWYVRLARASFHGSRNGLSYLDRLRANHGFKRES